MFSQQNFYWWYPGLTNNKGRLSGRNESNTETWAETREGGLESPYFICKQMNA